MSLFARKPVVVLASGPSLTLEDIEIVRKSGLKTIAVNSTWEKVRFCDVIFAGDAPWWIEHGERIDIPAVRASMSYNAERGQKATRFPSKVAGNGGYNSGCIAIEYAIANGSGPVLMIGFDCSLKNGVHHHGKHENLRNPTTSRCKVWLAQFHKLRKIYKDATIINCSRYTELKEFPCMTLESALESVAKSPLHAA
jgi:hypothetical protein